MKTQRTSLKALKSTLGAAIFALGLLLLFVNLDGAADQVGSMLGTRQGASGLLATIGLAGLHAVQAYTFNHEAFLSGLLQILVSFWPLLLVIAGAMLLRNSFQGRFAPKYTETRRSTWEIRL